MDHDQPVGPAATRQHEWLLSNVGKWNVDCTFYMDPSQPPMKLNATDVVEAHGRFFIVAKFAADMFGAPFHGIATTGYDPANEQFQSTWIDTMTPYLYVFTGQLDPSGKTLEFKGRAPNPMTQEMADWRTVEQRIDKDTRKFEMFMTTSDGHEIQLFTHVYERA
jgi:hypothetical protein